MKHIIFKKVKEQTRSYLSATARPWVVLLAVVMFGGLIIASIFLKPVIAVIVIGLTTIIVSAYIYILGRIIKNETFRLSDYAELPNYSYNTILSEITYDISDQAGKIANVIHHRKIQVENDITSIVEVSWSAGEGVRPEDIIIDPNEYTVGAIIRKGPNYFVEILFNKKYQRGDTVEFLYKRKIRDAFTSDKEWAETKISTKAQKVILSVIFPNSRPPKEGSMEAIHTHGDYTVGIGMGIGGFTRSVSDDNRIKLSWEIIKPVQRDVYSIIWEW